MDELLYKIVMEELAVLISDTDLHISQLVLTLLGTVMDISPASIKEVCLIPIFYSKCLIPISHTISSLALSPSDPYGHPPKHADSCPLLPPSRVGHDCLSQLLRQISQITAARPLLRGNFQSMHTIRTPLVNVLINKVS